MKMGLQSVCICKTFTNFKQIYNYFTSWSMRLKQLTAEDVYSAEMCVELFCFDETL